MKKSFILYTDNYEAIKDLSVEEKALLLDAVFNYHLGKELPEMTPLLKSIFTFFKISFDRDNEKYQKRVNANRENGQLGGRPPNNPDEPKKPTGLNQNPTKPNKTQQNPIEPKKPDNDNVNDNVNDINTYICAFEYFYDAYPLKKSKKKAIDVFNKICKKSNFTLEQAAEFSKQCIIAIEKQKEEKINLSTYNLFVPEWKHPTTWLNQECWNDEVKTEEEIKQHAIAIGAYKLTYAEKLQKCSGEESCQDYQGF